ncbi:MAG: M28 family peptidase [Ginsengibacter sp.]
MMRVILIATSIFMYSSAAGQADDSIAVKKIFDETLTNSSAYTNLRTLCKQVGPRLSGSANFSKAVQVVSQMMKDAGTDTVYLQECMIPHWVRGEKETGKIIISGEKDHDLKLCALGTSIGTGIKGLRADVVEVKSMPELHQLGDKVKGKIVFFNFRMNPTYLRVFQAYGESGIARRLGAAQAAKYGAIGVMVRSLAINLNDYPHTGTMSYNDSFPKIPAVAISTNDAEWLSKMLSNSKVVTASFKTYCKQLPDVKGYNVVGEIRGSQFPKEIITVGGHLDSWDLAEGANDDGSGVVQSVEVLRALKKAGTFRTVRAVAFANEEISGTGADAYLAQAKKNNEQHIFALESDAGGFTPRGFRLEMDTAKMQKIYAWNYLLNPYGLYETGPGGSGADVGPLKAIGTALAGLNTDSQRYFDLHHAATDTFENVSERELNFGAAAMAALVYLVSEHGL